MQHLLALVQVLDELGDAACESKLGRFIAALIGERDFQALVEERELAQAVAPEFHSCTCDSRRSKDRDGR